MTSIRITVTVPKEVLNSDFVRQKILQTMRAKTGPDLRKEFKKTVEGWENPPDFSQAFHDRAGGLSTEVWASGKNANQYALVNAGSPPHTITPHRGMLRFQVGYRPATRPRVIGSRAKSRFGNFISTPLVHHPGFEARLFDQTIAESYFDTFAQDIQDAISSATKR